MIGSEYACTFCRISFPYDSELWETCDMAKPMPELYDPVVIEGKTGTFVVTGIDTVKKIANVRSTTGPFILHQDVPLSAISCLAESQNAARIAMPALVGRDPDKLDRAGMICATVESIAKNLSDGIIAPLLFSVRRWAGRGNGLQSYQHA